MITTSFSTFFAARRFEPEVFTAIRAGGAAEEFSVAADGAVTRGGRTVARIEAARVVAPSGATLATLGADGTVRVEGSRRTLRFEGDAVVRDDGVRAVRAADGRVVLRDAAGAEAATPWTIAAGASPVGLATVFLALALVDGLGDAMWQACRAATDAGDTRCRT